MKPLTLALLALLLTFPGPAAAQNKESETIVTWPNTGVPTFKIAFGKFRGLASYSGRQDYEEDVTVENLSSQNIAAASFTVYLLDKDKVRIADSILQVKDLGPGQQVRQSLQFRASGVPASVTLVAHTDASGIPTSLKTVPIKIISVPPGAQLKIDGQDVGFTPYTASLPVGSHSLELRKEGFADGNTPLEITQDEAPGGSITIELGGLSRDTIEFRDGTVVLGDVLSMSIDKVVVRIAGQQQTYDRNRVKKIILVERDVVTEPGAKRSATKP